MKSFTTLLHTVPLLVVDTRKDVDEVKELVAIAKEYLIALRCELKRKEEKDNLSRAAELAAYFTHCKLESVHLVLGLRLAMTVFFKLKNLDTCATFCRRLIELNPGQKVSQHIRSSQGPVYVSSIIKDLEALSFKFEGHLLIVITLLHRCSSS